MYVQGVVAGDMPGRGEPLALVPALISFDRWGGDYDGVIPDRM